MSQGVQIINTTQVSVPLPLPHSPPPPHIRLSFFDVIWIGFPPIQRLLLYSNNDHTMPISTLVDFLKSSLSSTILDFLPLAGELTYVPSTGDVEIDCSNPAVDFVEAESDIDLHRLVTNEVHDAESFLNLVPPTGKCEMPFRVFSVQVTRFKCGGVAIGYATHHTVADGKAMWQFVEAWAGTCKAKISGRQPPEYRLPLYDRTVIKHPTGEDVMRQLLRGSAPNLPIASSPILPNLPIVDGVCRLTRRTFVLDASAIYSLKQRAMRHDNKKSDDINRSDLPSTFLAISAHSWTCFVRAISLESDETSVFCFPVDCRTCLDPPIEEGYFGNCVRFTYVNALVSELLADDGLSQACAKISDSIRETWEDPLRDVDDWMTNFNSLPFERLINVSASPRFKVYETDFGFGRPDRVEIASMNHSGEASLAGGKDDGTVQVTVALNSNQMEAYANAFVGDHLSN